MILRLRETQPCVLRQSLFFGEAGWVVDTLVGTVLGVGAASGVGIHLEN
ncbi:MAG: hypothetical protein U0892_01540 [Pirellulales bacterium]